MDFNMWFYLGIVLISIGICGQFVCLFLHKEEGLGQYILILLMLVGFVLVMFNMPTQSPINNPRYVPWPSRPWV